MKREEIDAKNLLTFFKKTPKTINFKQGTGNFFGIYFQLTPPLRFLKIMSEGGGEVGSNTADIAVDALEECYQDLAEDWTNIIHGQGWTDLEQRAECGSMILHIQGPRDQAESAVEFINSGLCFDLPRFSPPSHCGPCNKSFEYLAPQRTQRIDIFTHDARTFIDIV